MLLSRTRISEKIIHDCLLEFDKSVDRKSYMDGLMFEKLEGLNNKDLAEFDKRLSELIDKVNEPDASLYEIAKIVSILNKACKRACKIEMLLLESV